MLVLSRKVNEAIKIGDSIEVRIVAIRGNKVRLGITAPKNISVSRDDFKCHCADPSKCGINCCRRFKHG
jgi:carbon storage regulator